MQVEILSSNIFFRALRHPSNRDVWESAQRNKWLVCVPQTCSFAFSKVTLADIESHVLRPEEGSIGPGMYRALSGLPVSIVGNRIFVGTSADRRGRLTAAAGAGAGAGAGGATASPERRPSTHSSAAASSTTTTTSSCPSESGVEIIYTQEVQVGVGEESCPPSPSSPSHSHSRVLHVLYISKPLLGGLDAPNGSDNMDRGMIKKFVALLWSHPGVDSVLSSLDSFAKKIVELGQRSPSGQSQLSRVRPNLRSCLQQRCMRATESIVLCTKRDAEADIERVYWDQFHQVVESYLMERVHSVVFPHICHEHRRSTQALAAAMAAYDGRPLPTSLDFGVTEEFDVPLDAAVRLLQTLNTDACRTPLEKAQCLVATSQCIRSEVERHVARRERGGSSAENTPGRDRRRGSSSSSSSGNDGESEEGGGGGDNAAGKPQSQPSQNQGSRSPSPARESRRPSRSQTRDYTFTTDDLLCLIISAVARAGPTVHNLLANIVYMNQFHFVGVSTTAVGYHIAHFQAAAEYLIGEGPGSKLLPRTPTHSGWSGEGGGRMSAQGMDVISLDSPLAHTTPVKDAARDQARAEWRESQRIEQQKHLATFR